jgi:hypothetical protein
MGFQSARRTALKESEVNLMSRRLCVGLLLAVLSNLSISALAAEGGLGKLRPYRALLVVERWSDPASQIVDADQDEFQPVAAPLQAWSVPFDILRLDQQHLDATYLFDRSGGARYGVVVWLADAASYAGQNLAALEEAVGAGTSLVVASSRFLDPALERALSLKFKEAYSATDPYKVTQPHFITRQLAEQKMDRFNVSGDESAHLWVEPHGAEVLIAQGRYPILTLRQLEAGSSAIWMGVSPSIAALRDSPYWRGLFFRALVWSFGYMVQPDIDYSHRLVITFDDWGASEKSFSNLFNWHFPTLSEQEIRERLIAPLAKRNAVVAADVVSGFVDRKTHRIVTPWTQKFTDGYGALQDYASTYKGLKAALAAEVLEIASHGWTHMEPDLESPPGPWWTADPAGEGSAIGWVSEFEDWRRKREIPATVQLFHMKRSRDALREDFGQTPLSLLPGEYAWSKSYANHTGRLAAQADFGIFHTKSKFFYLDRDLVLDMSGIGPEVGHGYDRPLRADLWPPHPDGPACLTVHDRDLAFQADFLDRLFAALPAGTETLSLNRYVAILHTRITSSSSDGWGFEFEFPAGYGVYFARHASGWRLWLSDTLRERLKAASELNVVVDGKAARRLKPEDLGRESLVVEVPQGVGQHLLKISPVR